MPNQNIDWKSLLLRMHSTHNLKDPEKLHGHTAFRDTNRNAHYNRTHSANQNGDWIFTRILFIYSYGLKCKRNRPFGGKKFNVASPTHIDTAHLDTGNVIRNENKHRIHFSFYVNQSSTTVRHYRNIRARASNTHNHLLFKTIPVLYTHNIVRIALISHPILSHGGIQMNISEQTRCFEIFNTNRKICFIFHCCKVSECLCLKWASIIAENDAPSQKRHSGQENVHAHSTHTNSIR